MTKTLGSESVTIIITTLVLADVNEILVKLGDVHFQQSDQKISVKYNHKLLYYHFADFLSENLNSWLGHLSHPKIAENKSLLKNY